MGKNVEKSEIECFTCKDNSIYKYRLESLYLQL